MFISACNSTELSKQGTKSIFETDCEASITLSKDFSSPNNVGGAISGIVAGSFSGIINVICAPGVASEMSVVFSFDDIAVSSLFP